MFETLASRRRERSVCHVRSESEGYINEVYVMVRLYTDRSASIGHGAPLVILNTP